MQQIELVQLSGSETLRRWTFPPGNGSVSVGRAPECDIQLDGWRVGKRHATMIFEHDAWYVHSNGSFSELRVNGVRCEGRTSLQESDMLEIGPHTLTVCRSSAVVAAPCSLPPLDAVVPNQIVDVVADAPMSSIDPAFSDQVAALHRRFRETVELHRSAWELESDTGLRARATQAIRELAVGAFPMLSAADREQIVLAVVAEAVGFGALEPLLDDPLVTEIMVNRHDEIFVERAGTMVRVAHQFTDDAAVRAVLERIVAPIGRRIDESSPMVDARLPDGSRVNAVIPPLALRGASMTIRRFRKGVMSFEDLRQQGSASDAMLAFLHCAVHAQRNVIVSGGTGSGKTTLLNALSQWIPAHERVVSIEDAAELQLQLPNKVVLEARPANAEGQGGVSIRDLVKNALRMRPDRIVIGECRGAEALDMLQAMNTGHEGSLTTLHANSPRDVFSRLEVMVLMAGFDIPVLAIREQIASAIDLVVHQARGPDGKRRIVEIVEVTGMEGGTIQTQSLFEWRRCASSGQRFFEGCGVPPRFEGVLRERGSGYDIAWFSDRTASNEASSS